MVELNEKGLEAAHHAYEKYGQAGDLKTQRLSDGCMAGIITAYLASLPEEVVFCPNCGWNSAMDGPALPAPDDGLVERVTECTKEYAEIGFWRTCSGCHETEDGYDVGHYPHSKAFGCKLGSGCSECGGIGAVWDTTDYAAMGEELSKEVTSTREAAALQYKDEQIEWLTRERDEALAAEDEAKDSFWAIYPDWVKMKGHGISTEAARTMLVERADDLEQQVQKLTAEVERPRKALLAIATGGLAASDAAYVAAVALETEDGK